MLKERKITTNFERHNIPVERLDSYENKVMTAESLLQIIEVIFSMFKDLMNVASKENELVGSLLDSRNQFKTEDGEVGDENYKNLEKVLQKYEAEIRNHIRIEQQLKIYTEGLQEKMEEKQNSFETKLGLRDKKIKVRENKK